MTNCDTASPKPSGAGPAAYQTAELALRELQAADYERWFLATKGHFFDLREKGLFLSLVRATRFRAVLEIGCGTGRITQTVAACVEHVTALDFSAASVAVLRAKRIRNITADCANACEGLPFSPGSFQLVLACQVLQHLRPNDLLTVLGEARRVLEPGGRLAFTAYNLDHFRYAGAEETAGNGLYCRRFSSRFVRHLAAGCGFHVAELKYYKAIPSRFEKLGVHSQGALRHFDRAVCALPVIGARLAGYLFSVLVRTG